jgi:gamma-glutamyltranspeptidase/glutathione hydrolase
VEKDFPQATLEELEKMGYHVKKREHIGRTEVIRISEAGGIEAVGDKRGDDTALGY